MDQYSEMMGSSKASLFLQLAVHHSAHFSFIHVLSSHFLNFIYTRPFCFHTFSSLSRFLSYFFFHIVSPTVCWVQCILPAWVEKYFENPEGGLQDGSSRKWGCRNKEEALTHEMVWHCRQEGGKKKVVKRERMRMLKIQPELESFFFCFSLAFASLNWGLWPLSLMLMSRRNINIHRAKLHQEALI